MELSKETRLLRMDGYGDTPYYSGLGEFELKAKFMMEEERGRGGGEEEIVSICRGIVQKWYSAGSGWFGRHTHAQMAHASKLPCFVTPHACTNGARAHFWCWEKW